MEFQIIWFILWGVLWAVYFMLDGFDFGAGILQSFLGKNESFPLFVEFINSTQFLGFFRFTG